jgi:hypothetical protein
MRLVYQKNQQEVSVGDVVRVKEILYKVVHFNPPHQPASSGKVSIRLLGGTLQEQVYVGIIGAEWIEREDRADEDSVEVVRTTSRDQLVEEIMAELRLPDWIPDDKLMQVYSLVVGKVEKVGHDKFKTPVLPMMGSN